MNEIEEGIEIEYDENEEMEEAIEDVKEAEEEVEAEEEEDFEEVDILDDLDEEMEETEEEVKEEKPKKTKEPKEPKVDRKKLILEFMKKNKWYSHRDFEEIGLNGYQVRPHLVKLMNDGKLESLKNARR